MECLLETLDKDTGRRAEDPASEGGLRGAKKWNEA